jgi:hypothetical protein
MSGNRDGAAMVGVGALACAACCAGPILGFLAALGLGTFAGAMVFGAGALFVGGAVAAAVVGSRRRRAAACAVTDVDVPVEMSAERSTPATGSQ